MPRSITLSFADLLDFLRKEIDRQYPYDPGIAQLTVASPLVFDERNLFMKFVDNPLVRDGLKEFCRVVMKDPSPEELADSLAAHILPKKPSTFLKPYSPRMIKALCRELGRWVHVYMDMQKEPSQGISVGPQAMCELPPKITNLSEEYFAGLTAKQADVVSLRLEYGLTIPEIARRLGRHRTTIEETYKAAHKKIDERGIRQKSKKRQARTTARSTDSFSAADVSDDDLD